MPLDPADHVGLAWSIAAKFFYVPDHEAVVCEGLLALVRAAPAFDETRGYRPATFLGTVIRYACIGEARRQRKKMREVPLYVVTAEGEEQERPDLPVTEPVAVERVLARELREAVGRLPARERLIVEQRYGLHDDTSATTKAVGEAVGLCHQRVGQVAARGVERLRKDMTRTGRPGRERHAGR